MRNQVAQGCGCDPLNIISPVICLFPLPLLSLYYFYHFSRRFVYFLYFLSHSLVIALFLTTGGFCWILVEKLLMVSKNNSK